MMSVAWTRKNRNPDDKTNRVFCTTLGAATDLSNEDLRRMVINAVLWGFTLKIPAKTDIRFVDEFAPAPYCFKGYRRGLNPDDHALGKVLPPGTPPPLSTPKKKS